MVTLTWNYTLFTVRLPQLSWSHCKVTVKLSKSTREANINPPQSYFEATVKVPKVTVNLPQSQREATTVVTFSWNTWVSITIHLHMCRALPSPQCWVKQILVLAITVINIGRRHSYKCSNKCDDDCLWRGTKDRPIFVSPRAKLTPKMDPAQK